MTTTHTASRPSDRRSDRRVRRRSCRARLSALFLACVVVAGGLAIVALAAGGGVAHAAPAPPAPSGPAATPAVPPLPVDPTTQQPWPPPTTAAGSVAPGVVVPPIQVGPTTAPGPSPSPTLPAPAGAGQQPQNPAWYDVAGQARAAINSWFRDLVTSGLQTVLDVLGQTVLATPDVTTMPQITGLWSMVQGIANTIFVLLVMVAGVIAMSHETLQTRYTLKDLLPRVVVGFVVANTSLSLLGQGITAANALSAALLGQGVSPHDLVTRLNHEVVTPLASAGIFLLLLALVLLVLVVILVVVWIVRFAVTVLLAVAGPLAGICHATPYTEGLARLWWRAVIGVLVIQLAQSLTLIVALQSFVDSIDATPGIGATASRVLAFLAFVVLLYVEIRIPTWVFHHVNGGGRSALGSLVKLAVMSKTMGMLGISRSGARAGRALRRGGPGPTAAGPGSPPPAPPEPPHTPSVPGPPGGGPTSSGGVSPGAPRPTPRPSGGQPSNAQRARQRAHRAWNMPAPATEPTSTRSRTSATPTTRGASTPRPVTTPAPHIEPTPPPTPKAMPKPTPVANRPDRITRFPAGPRTATASPTVSRTSQPNAVAPAVFSSAPPTAGPARYTPPRTSTPASPGITPARISASPPAVPVPPAAPMPPGSGPAGGSRRRARRRSVQRTTTQPHQERSK